MQRSKRKEEDIEKEKTNAAGRDSGDVDALVSGFLGELAAISPDKSNVRQPEAIEKKQAESTSKPGRAYSGSGEWEVSGLTLELEGIDKEIEESLDELERLKSGIPSSVDRKDPAPEPVPLAKTAEEAPSPAPVPAAETAHPAAPKTTSAATPAKAPAHASTTRSKPAAPPENPYDEEQAWTRLELARSGINSFRPFPWLKAVLGAAIVVTILGIGAYQLLRLRTVQNSPVAGRASSAPESVPQPAGSATGVTTDQVKAESVTDAPAQHPRPAAAQEEEIARTAALEPDISATEEIARTEATPGLLESADATPPPATSDNKILLPGAGDKASVPLAASTSANLEPLQPRSQPLIALPAQSKVLVPAVPIFQPGPSYPELALRSRTSSSVVLELQVDESGRVTKAIPVNGPVLFHSAAVAAALKWRYKPATIDGKNVSSQVRATINFSLNK